ncbi:MAG: hypothetical protein LBF32_01120 [Streptococcaceae bacterium]|jgi:hypothetical protein|nr:hypothetical protein [Streptococcaceae bacterium]
MNKKFKKLVFGLILLAPLACTVPAKAQQFGEATPASSEQLPLTWWDSTSRFDRQVTTGRKSAVVQQISSVRDRYNTLDASLSASNNYTYDQYQCLVTRELPEVRNKFGQLLEWDAIVELNIMADYIKSLMSDVYDGLHAICLHEAKWSLTDLETKTADLTAILNKVEETKTEFQNIKNGLNNKKFSQIIPLKKKYFSRYNVIIQNEWFTAFVDE